MSPAKQNSLYFLVRNSAPWVRWRAVIWHRACLQSWWEFSCEIDLIGKCLFSQTVFFLDFFYFKIDILATNGRRRRQIYLLIDLSGAE